MLLSLYVNADTSLHAGEQAKMMAKAQGFSNPQVRKIVGKPIPIDNAFAMLAASREFNVTLDVTRGFSHQPMI